MPLEESGSDEAFERNLKEMLAAGHPRDQALAAAYAIKRKNGGKDETAAKAFPRLLILKADAPRPPPPQPIDLEPIPEVIAAPVAEPAPIPAIEEAPRMGTADQIEEAKRFGELGKAVRLIDPERLHVSHLVGSDLAEPGLWRHTTLVDGQPWEDREFTKAEDAFLSALHAGGLPMQPEPTPPQPDHEGHTSSA